MFKRKVEYILLNESYDFTKNQHGNWIDLATEQHEYLSLEEGFPFVHVLVPLGVKMTLPKWYRAEIKPRSSLFKSYRCLLTNSVGEIEHDYADTWLASLVAFTNEMIPVNTRIVQFQISLRSDAPWYLKIMDLFISGYKFVRVSELKTSRGGFGSTNNKS